MAITQEYEAARKANEQRYAQAMQIYDEIISRYRPGGAFQTAQLGELEKRMGRMAGKEQQQLISSGLFGTTVTAGIPGRLEAEVGGPERLRLEDIMMQRLSTAQTGKAGFIERREDVYPDVGAYAQYAGQAAAEPAGGRTTYGAVSFPDMFSPFGGAAGTAPTPTTTPAAAPARASTPTTPTAPPPGSPQSLWEAGTWGESLEAEQERAGPGGMYDTQFGTTTPTAGKKATPTISEYLQQHGLDPTSTNKGDIKRAQTLQKQYASLYR